MNGRYSASDIERMAALQQALAGEHAAVWAGGRAAAKLAGQQRADALAGLEVSRNARDKLMSMVIAAGGQPVPAAAAYLEPDEVTGAGTARDLLAHVNLALCPIYAGLVGHSDPADRKWPLRRCREAALSALAWGAPPMPFPGPLPATGASPGAGQPAPSGSS
jgi:hypothetical protein